MPLMGRKNKTKAGQRRVPRDLGQLTDAYEIILSRLGGITQ